MMQRVEHLLSRISQHLLAVFEGADSVVSQIHYAVGVDIVCQFAFFPFRILVETVEGIHFLYQHTVCIESLVAVSGDVGIVGCCESSLA